LTTNDRAIYFNSENNSYFSELVNKAISLGYDFSDFAGIPGYIGGAVFGNAGTHHTGRTIGDSIIKIIVFNFETGQYETINPIAYPNFFSERNSFLKESNRVKTKYLIISVVLKAQYIGIKEATDKKKKIIEIRKDSDIEGRRTAGSFFANGALPENLAKQGLKVRDLIRELGLNTLNFNGAGYTDIKCFLKTESQTTDYNIALLLDETIYKIKTTYGFCPTTEVQILDFDGIITAEQFIRRYANGNHAAA